MQKTGKIPSDYYNLKVEACGQPEDFISPCVDCGHVTGSWCDKGTTDQNCYLRTYLHPMQFAKAAYPADKNTPLCTSCDSRFNMCPFCRGVPSATPEAWQHKDGVPATLAAFNTPNSAPYDTNDEMRHFSHDDGVEAVKSACCQPRLARETGHPMYKLHHHPAYLSKA